MSMHKKPLTIEEEMGLIISGMGDSIGKPSQSADTFRNGIRWAHMTKEEQIEHAKKMLNSEWPRDKGLRDRLYELRVKLKELCLDKNQPLGECSMKKYPVAIHQEEGTCYGVTVPDLLGCFSAGDTIEEALTNVREAIKGHIEILKESGEYICDPKTIEFHIDNPDYVGALWQYVNIEDDAVNMNNDTVSFCVPIIHVTQEDNTFYNRINSAMNAFTKFYTFNKYVLVDVIMVIGKEYPHRFKWDMSSDSIKKYNNSVTTKPFKIFIEDDKLSDNINTIEHIDHIVKIKDGREFYSVNGLELLLKIDEHNRAVNVETNIKALEYLDSKCNGYVGYIEIIVHEK